MSTCSHVTDIPSSMFSLLEMLHECLKRMTQMVGMNMYYYQSPHMNVSSAHCGHGGVLPPPLCHQDYDRSFYVANMLIIFRNVSLQSFISHYCASIVDLSFHFCFSFNDLVVGA